MKGEDSVFSFIKRQEQPESAPQRSAAPSYAPVPPPPPSENFTKLASRITELEDKLKGLDLKAAGQGSAAPDVLRPEVLAAQQRILALERMVVHLQQVAEAAGREAQAAKALAPGHDAVGAFRAELQASQQRAAVLERTIAHLQQVAEAAGREAQAAKALAPGHDAVGALKTELQASQQRVAALERLGTELQKFTEVAGLETKAAKAAGRQELAKFRDELDALRAKEDSAEALHRGLTEAAERSLKNFEAGVLGELKERLQALDAASADITHKANLISATTAGNAHRIDKLEERAAGLKYLENRLEANDKKFEKLYELEALVQAVKVGMESLENKVGVLAQDTAGMSAEHQGIRSDFESTTHEVKQLSALFNYFRTELAFLLPKKKEGVGSSR